MLSPLKIKFDFSFEETLTGDTDEDRPDSLMLRLEDCAEPEFEWRDGFPPLRRASEPESGRKNIEPLLLG